MKSKGRIMWFVLALMWSVCLWWLLTAPSSNLPQITWLYIRHTDKFIHFALFALLSFLWLRCLGVKILNLLIVLSMTLVYGLLVEYWQYYVPGRYPSTHDYIANVAGILVGMVLAILLRKRNW